MGDKRPSAVALRRTPVITSAAAIVCLLKTPLSSTAMSLLKTLQALLLPLGLAEGVLLEGGCNKSLKAVKQLYKDGFWAGQWYEHARYPVKDETAYICRHWNFLPGTYKKRQVKFTTTYFEATVRTPSTTKDRLKITFDEKKTRSGKLVEVANTDGADGAVYQIQYKGEDRAEDHKYKILATDHNEFAVVASCENKVDVNGQVTHREERLFLLKSVFPTTDEAMTGFNETMDKFGFDKELLSYTAKNPKCLEEFKRTFGQ